MYRFCLNNYNEEIVSVRGLGNASIISSKHGGPILQDDQVPNWDLIRTTLQ
jgi:hypothetical protein